jgi:hypothetical protein
MKTLNAVLTNYGMNWALFRVSPNNLDLHKEILFSCHKLDARWKALHR